MRNSPHHRTQYSLSQLPSKGSPPPLSPPPNPSAHSLLAQNRSLRATVADLTNSLSSLQSEVLDLRHQLSAVVQEIDGPHPASLCLRGCAMREQPQEERRWEEERRGERELERERERVGRLLEHNRNLEIENRLVLEIKQKYSADLAQLRAESEELRRENARLRGENEKLRRELGSLAGELAQLEKDFYSPRQPSLQQLPTAATLQSPSSLEAKYLKYKHKSQAYKAERDQLLRQLSPAPQ